MAAATCDRSVLTEAPVRPSKMGFAAPIVSWLRGRDWAETLLAPKRFAADNLLPVEAVRRARAHTSRGTCN
jgi:hypothetical protein